MIKILKQISLSLLALFAGKAAHSQMWELQTGNDDPFEGITFDGPVHPATADVDNDGDTDIVGGICYEPWMSFFENEGNNSFNNVQGVQNPFEGIDACSNPEFVDIDGDGDLDLVVGTYEADKYAVLKLYRNNAGVFEEDPTNNPFEGITAYYDAHPAFSDIDDDGDLDLVLGSYNGLSLYLNNGTNNFEATGMTSDNFESLSGYGNVTPAFADIDLDGDEDAIFGSKYGDLKYFEKDNGVFVQRDSIDNPFYGLPLSINPTPHFYDHDGDTDMDLMLGDAQGNFQLYLNTMLSIGLDNAPEVSVRIYPNPTSETLFIEGPVNAQYANIFSMDGKLVHSKPYLNNDPRIDVASLSNGNYILKVTCDEGVFTSSFIKN